MKNSSPQDIYSITLNPCNEISLTTGTVTIDLESSYNYSNTMAGDYMTISPIPSISTIDISTFDTQYEIDFGEEWRTHFPDFKQIEEMCKEYPALQKALENFKTIYEMVKDDYASKPRKEDQ